MNWQIIRQLKPIRGSRLMMLIMLMTLLRTATAMGQYKVEGGKFPPLLVAESSLPGNRIQVYLVYGAADVTVSYTSASASHRWYRYRTRAFEREAVNTARQQGTTSTLDSPTEGYGYAVIEGDNYITAEYVWLIDYASYPSDLSELRINSAIDPCLGFQLDGNDLSTPLSYRTPGGVAVDVPRRYEISYRSMQWDEANKQFTDVMVIDTLEKPLRWAIDNIPLQDTDIKLTGDLFGIHFGTAKTYEINAFQAARIEVHADSTVISQGSTNLAFSSSDGELLAPAEMRFTAYANKPTASFFKWKIVRKSDKREIVNFTGEELEYTFATAGNYTVLLEVSDRTGKCVNSENSFDIAITETKMEVPNAFTPVGSPGVNDLFKVAYQSVVSFRATVFNRWGSELFSWSDPAQGWDGKYRGRYVPAGPYFYVIEYVGTDGVKRRKSGDINVIHLKEGQITAE